MWKMHSSRSATRQRKVNVSERYIKDIGERDFVRRAADMGRKEFLGLLLLMVCLTCALGEEGCEPDCTGKPPGLKVPDPKNCTQYYVCMIGEVPTDAPYSCNLGEEFDPVLGACVSEYGCVPTCKSSCHMTCQGNEDHIADPLNCSIFYVCDINGPGEAEACPGSFPHYDHVHKACVNDESVCCHPDCSPYCDIFSIQVPDPTNCSRYYLCDLSTHKPQPTPKECPPGEVFNIGIAHCDPTAQCKEWCPTTTTTSTTTTTITPTTTTTTTPKTTTTTTPTTTTTTTPTTTTTTTPTTTTTAAQPTGCVGENLVCPDEGFFSKCGTYCDPQYYICAAAGATASLERCSSDLVFNPVPQYPYCILLANCPYTPSV